MNLYRVVFSDILFSVRSFFRYIFFLSIVSSFIGFVRSLRLVVCSSASCMYSARCWSLFARNRVRHGMDTPSSCKWLKLSQMINHIGAREWWNGVRKPDRKLRIVTSGSVMKKNECVEI